MKTVVFILSETRSGSTWLSYVLGSHENAAHLGEYHRPFTIPGHVACRICEAKAQRCPVFDGIQRIKTDDAFDFAFERLGVEFLVDCSKDLGWIRHFLNRDYRIKVIHLFRDPKGWFASERKREPMTPEQGLRRWQETNRQIDCFVGENRLDCMRALYEDLTADPYRHFPALCEFVGFAFDPKALQYWEREHHGLGANGAAFNVLAALPNAKLVTGDDPYYRSRAEQIFQDDRWKTLLTEEEIAFFSGSKALDTYFEASSGPA